MSEQCKRFVDKHVIITGQAAVLEKALLTALPPRVPV